jgi:hypothetical protein
MELSVGKCLKLDKPFMSNLASLQPHLIKVTDPVPNNLRADKKASENAKAGKVTTVVAVMHIFGQYKCNSHNANAEICAKKVKLCPKLKEKGLNWLAYIWKRNDGPQTMLA